MEKFQKEKLKISLLTGVSLLLLFFAIFVVAEKYFFTDERELFQTEVSKGYSSDIGQQNLINNDNRYYIGGISLLASLTIIAYIEYRRKKVHKEINKSDISK